MADGHGASLTFGTTSGFTGRLTQIGALRRYRDELPDTALADDDEKFCPGGLRRSDPVECEYYCNPDMDPLTFLNADPETITITSPPGDGQTNGATRTGSGFVSSISDPSYSTGENLVGNMTIRFTGAITVAAGS